MSDDRMRGDMDGQCHCRMAHSHNGIIHSAVVRGVHHNRNIFRLGAGNESIQSRPYRSHTI